MMRRQDGGKMLPKGRLCNQALTKNRGVPTSPTREIPSSGKAWIEVGSGGCFRHGANAVIGVGGDDDTQVKLCPGG